MRYSTLIPGETIVGISSLHCLIISLSFGGVDISYPTEGMKEMYMLLVSMRKKRELWSYRKWQKISLFFTECGRN